jgi:hypothetical protein
VAKGYWKNRQSLYWPTPTMDSIDIGGVNIRDVLRTREGKVGRPPLLDDAGQFVSLFYSATRVSLT